MEIRDYRKKVPEDTKYKDGNYLKGRCGWTPGLITLHTTDGSYQGSCDWFCNPAAGVSAHYVIGLNGEITQCVDIADTAYVNGTTNKNPDDKRYYKKATNPIVKARSVNANYYTVGIEIAGYYNKESDKCSMTEKQKSAAIELIADIVTEIKERYSSIIPLDRTRICGHYEVNPITKPFCGKGFPYDEIIKKVTKKIFN